MIGEGEEQNAVIAETTNLPEIGYLLEDTIRKMDSDPDSFAKIIENGIQTAAQFANPDAERESIVTFFESVAK